MQIVINIDEDLYEMCRDSLGDEDNIEGIIANGTPLPKGHGRLVDLDKMCADYWDGNYMEIHEDDLKNIKPIIEADTESEASE